MQSSSKRPIEIDPDYEISDSAIKRIKIKEQQDKEELLQKVTNIITSHFNTELTSRQAQIDTIQERIVKMRKTMHLLRYVLVKSYYNNKNCVLNTVEEPTGLIDPQSRIHPAVKRLIGKNASFNFSSSRRTKPLIKTEICSENETHHDEVNNRVPTAAVVVNGESSNSCDSVRNRRKRKYRLVVGNISKYMPAKNREDNSTHKWMIYVRGSKEAPNVSHFIKKVVFYLHPSYKPCDVIELDKDPFHLSRRGWGEFPVRVQIFFHCTLNKPVDIIHNLKLDKTHTGRQTLGNETVVDLYLYENNVETRTSDEKEVTVKEEVIVNTEPITTNPSYEHDYYTSDTELPVDVDCVQLDHTYCLPDSSEDANIKQEESSILCDLKINGNSMFKHSTIKQLIPQLLSKETHVKVLKIMDKDGKAVIISKNESSSTVIDYNKYKINIPVEKFKCVLEILPFLFRRLPLVTNLADSLSYKCRYPYVAKTLGEYCTWNVGRRRSSEWRRAKTVLEYLHCSKIFGYERWSTKLLIMYARAHAYTPSTTYTLFESIPCKSLLTNYKVKTTSTPPALLPEPNVPINVIDVENDDDVPEFKLSKNAYLSRNCTLECSFIRKVAADARVKLQPEEIAPGVLCNAAEIMIWESLKCFVNDLVRNARTHLVLRGNFCEESSVIATQDVATAIHDRGEFQRILQSFSNKSDMEYYM